MSGSNPLAAALGNVGQGNPLQYAAGYADLATKAMALRQQQANQAIGGILQQATDANGNVDYGTATRLASQAGPQVQLGMQSYLLNASKLRGEQINNAAGNMKLVGQAAMSVMNDPSDDNVNSSLDNLVRSGMPVDQINAERQALLGMSNPDDRRRYAYQHGLTSLDTLHQVAGQTTGVNVGGQIVPVTVTQPNVRGPGGLATGPGSVTTTASPGEVLGLPDIVYPATTADVQAGRASSVGQEIRVSGADRATRFGLSGLLPPGAREVPGTGGSGGRGPGVVDSSGNAVSPSNPPRLLNTPGGNRGGSSTPPPPPPSTQGGVQQGGPPPAPPGATGGSSSPYTGGGVGNALNPPAASTPSAVPSGRRSDLGGGVQIASTNALAPNVGAASPPSSAVAGDVSAIQRGITNARATPGGGTQTAYNTIAVGPGTEEAQGYKTSADKLASDDLAAANFQSTQFPYVQALKAYGEGTKTGPTTDFWNQVAGTIRTPLAKIGIDVGPLSDTTERVDKLGKWLASIQSSNPISQRSDAELAQVLKGSASTHINEVAGEDMVKAGLALQRMNFAANREWHQMSPQDQAQYGTYLRFLGNYNSNTDPRAFMVDTLNPGQVQRLRSQLQNGSEADAQRFESSLALARRNGVISGAGSQAMP